MLQISNPEFRNLLKDVVSKGHTLRSKALGRSMYPLIHNDDIVIIESEDATGIRSGDIVLFQSSTNGAYVVHRVIKKTRSATLITKGDNTLKSDKPIVAEHIIGKVIQVQSNGRQLNLSGRLSRLFALVTACLINLNFRGRFRLTHIIDRSLWSICGKSTRG